MVRPIRVIKQKLCPPALSHVNFKSYVALHVSFHFKCTIHWRSCSILWRLLTATAHWLNWTGLKECAFHYDDMEEIDITIFPLLW